SYTYTLNTAGVQHLAAGATVTDSFGYKASDGSATSTTVTLVVTIAGVNDAPGAHYDTAGMTEDTPTVSCNVLPIGADVDDGAVLPVAAPRASTGTPFPYTPLFRSSYTYTLNTAGVQHLAAGATVTDSFGYKASDGSATSTTATLVVTITGV